MLGSLDIDQCMTDNGNCQQICNNTLPGFLCDCRDGYALNSDGYTCDGEWIDSNK